MYFKKLADAAGALSKKGLDARESALKRITEFKAGCDKLAKAAHLQIKNEDQRRGLISKCEQWSTKLEALISQMKKNPAEWESVVSNAVKLSKEMQSELLEMSRTSI